MQNTSGAGGGGGGGGISGLMIPLYILIFLLAVVGNFLVLITLARNKRMRTAVSDILLGVFCMPFTLIGQVLQNFVFGPIMCKLISYFQAVSVSVAVWTLVAISLERYFAICRPLKSRRWQTQFHAYKMIGLVWLSSLLWNTPILYVTRLKAMRDKGRHKCREEWPSSSSRLIFNLFLDVILLLVPLVIMSLAYSLIVSKLWKGLQRELKHNSNNRSKGIIGKEMLEEEEEDEEEVIYRIDVSLCYAKDRSELGRPYQHFRPVGPITVMERRPDAEAADRFVKLVPEPVSTQTDLDTSWHELVTDKTPYKHSSMIHVCGGWPKEINDYDTDAINRWRKKMMKNEELNGVMPKFYDLAERCLIQNNSLNIYENYFLPEEWDEPEMFAQPEVSILKHFRDACKTNIRPVQHMSLEPLDGVQVVAAYSHMTYMRRDFSEEHECYIWDITRLPEPIKTLEPTTPAVKLEFNPKFPRVVLGGLMTGQLCYWDLRAGTKPVQYTSLFGSFHDPPTGLLWTATKSGYDCFASSSDGQVIWYDIRKLDEPVESLIADLSQETEEPSLRNAVGISCLEFEPTIPTKFMIGTENGSVLVGNRKGKTISEKLSEPYLAFPSPVKALSRNPTYLKCFLCVGDCFVRIMAEDCKESYIFWSGAHNCWLTGGKWSDLKNSVFFVTRTDGKLDVWDLLQYVNKPALSLKVSDKSLRCLVVHKNGRLALAGGDDGMITLVEVSSHFYTQDKNEKVLVTAMLDRESKREKLIDARNREVKLLQKQREMTSGYGGGEVDMAAVKEKTRNDFVRFLDDYDTKLLKKLKGVEDEEDYK